jgi:hypothetical protein
MASRRLTASRRDRRTSPSLAGSRSGSLARSIMTELRSQLSWSGSSSFIRAAQPVAQGCIAPSSHRSSMSTCAGARDPSQGML